MATSAMQKEHVLFVTGPLRERLYEHFSALFDGRDDVQVRVDRRRGERRREQRAVDGERRSHERRRRDPDWVVPPPDLR